MLDIIRSMAEELEFTYKAKEVREFMKEQIATRRAKLTVPFSEDAQERTEQHALYMPYCEFSDRGGELGFANINTRKRVDTTLVDVLYRVRVVAVRREDEAYVVDVRFNDSELIK